MTARVLVSQSEYARRRGVSRQRIHQLIREGRIPLVENGRIDALAADAALAEPLRVGRPPKAESEIP